METKSKPCKAIGKAHGFESCGNPTYKRTYGLCPKCLFEFYTTDERGKVIYAKSFLPKVKANMKSTQKAKDKSAMEKLKTLSEYKSDLQKVINSIVRKIDEGHPCIATGATTGKRNAGHYLSVQSNPTLRFHLENIWVQSEHSNMWKSGDTIKYQEGIVSLYGREYLDRLNGLKSIEPIRLTIEELKVYISRARQQLKWLESKNDNFTNEGRVAIRQLVNSNIGIYKP